MIYAYGDDIHDCVVMIYQSFGLDRKKHLRSQVLFLAPPAGLERKEWVRYRRQPGLTQLPPVAATAHILLRSTGPHAASGTENTRSGLRLLAANRLLSIGCSWFETGRAEPTEKPEANASGFSVGSPCWARMKRVSKISKTTWINPVAACGGNSAYSLEVHGTSCRKRHRE